MAQVRLEKVTKKYGKTEAVRDLDLIVEDSEFMTLVGPSGCGKSTTLRMIAGLEEITSGSLYIDNILANEIPPKDRSISMVFQSYALFPHMTVSENIGFGLKVKKKTREYILDRVRWAIDLLNLEGLEYRIPRDLSGGERQRVALARALVVEPKVLLLDEPLSNLDARLRLKMRAELKRIHKQLGATIIYVTHDQVEAMSLSDRVAVMNDGRLVQAGKPLDVYNRPESKFVGGFIGSPSMNFLDGTIIRRSNAVIFVTKDLELEFPKESFSNNFGTIDQEVVLGLRPEHIYNQGSTKAMTTGTNTAIDVVVDVVEPLGDRDIVTVTRGETVLTLLFSPEAGAVPDRPMKVVFDMSKCHLFDRKTGVRILKI
jgi:multiple sugar transport system ATP-binding protein